MQGRSEADPIRVLLADDHTMFRESIASVLADYGGIEVVGQTDNDEGAVELARLRKPNVVLMQVQMPISRAREARAAPRSRDIGGGWRAREPLCTCAA